MFKISDILFLKAEEKGPRKGGVWSFEVTGQAQDAEKHVSGWDPQ